MRYLQSKKLTILLIIALVLASLAGVIVPQEVKGNGEFLMWEQKYSLLAPAVKLLGLNQVFQTKWFLLLGLLFFINLTCCTLGQIKRVWKLWNAFHQEGSTVPKGFWRVFGNCIFHIGLAIIVVGGLLTFSYKMAGYVEVAEGETFMESHQNYGSITEGPLFNEHHLSFQFTVNKVNRIFTNDGQLDYVISQLTVTDNGRQTYEATVERGQPFTYRGTTFYYSKSGFAPFVTIKDPQGKTVLEGYAVFNSMWHNNTGEYTMDLVIPGTDLVLKSQLYPDALVKEGQISSKTLKITNPVIQATVLEKGKPVDKIEFKPGTDASFKGWTVGMKDVRLWTGFDIVRDPGAPVIFTGFVICLSGLIMSFLFTTRKPEKEQEDGC